MLFLYLHPDWRQRQSVCHLGTILDTDHHWDDRLIDADSVHLYPSHICHCSHLVPSLFYSVCPLLHLNFFGKLSVVYRVTKMDLYLYLGFCLDYEDYCHQYPLCRSPSSNPFQTRIRCWNQQSEVSIELKWILSSWKETVFWLLVSFYSQFIIFIR